MDILGNSLYLFVKHAIVIAANSCIVECENKGDSCQEACITSNW